MVRKAIVTDIEGTTSSIAFVKKVLFPYARRKLPGFVAARGSEPAVRQWLDAVARESGCPTDDESVVDTLRRWIDDDRKDTALKALEGMIWEGGYRNGDLTAHVYPDAVAALEKWRAAGMELYVYSSGSVTAQRLFFGHSAAGDQTRLFSGWFDTEVGSKRASESYQRIAETIGLPPPEVLFLSDGIEELDAARLAGMQTRLVDRPEDYPEPRTGQATHGHQRVESFASIA